MKKVFCLIFALCLLLLALSVPAWAEDPIISEDIFVTVSDRGVIAADKDQAPMINCLVSVPDTDGDGKITVHEALLAVHSLYNTPDGYAAGDNGYGGVSVTKLWGKNTYNTLFFVNHEGIPVGVATDTVEAGDYLVASVNSDDTYYADWYSYFDETELTVDQDDTFTLTLAGHLGMAYTPEDKEDVALAGIQIGTWQNGVFTPIPGALTDSEGKVSLSFSEPGTYYISASGTVEDEVVLDWSTYQTGTVGCPIIAPGCVVTVEPPALKGDINGDGQVLIDDLTYFLSYFRTGSPLPDESLKSADINGDKKITVADLVALLSYFSTGNWN